MYKIKELIDKGLDVNTLPEDIRQDINNLITATNNFSYQYDLAENLDEILFEKINTILNKENIEQENLFIGDAFFKKYPDKVLGEQTTGGRFGDSIIVKGSSDSYKNISTPLIPKKIFKDFGDLPIENKVIKDKIIDVVEKTKEAINNENNKKIIRIITKEESEHPEVCSFREVVEKYNKNISREELEAFLYSRPDLPYNKYIDNFQYTQSDLVKKGLLLYDSKNDKLEYRHIYLSGNLYEKRTNTIKDKDIIIEKFGEDYYNEHLKSIDENMPLRAELSEKGIGINILPHSEFAKTFMVKKEDLLFANKEYIPYNELSLYRAFKNYISYIGRNNPGLFSGSTQRDVYSYVVGNKIKTKSRSKDEKDNKTQEKEEKYAWQKAKEVADKLFFKMLIEELTIDAKNRLEIQWNEKYNTYKIPDYSKIPIGFTISKYFGNKELELNTLQRESVAFMNYIGSGCNAGAVGSGKTISAICCIAQAVDNGKANYPLLIVPNNVYEKWIRDIKGYYDDINDRQFIGVLHHYPKMRMLYNMSPEIIYAHKKYTDEERKEIEKLKNNFELVREQKKDILEKNEIPLSIFDIEKNPYAKIAITARQLAENRINEKLNKLRKDFESFIKTALSYPKEYIEKKQDEFNKIVKKENEKLPAEFARIYYDLVKDEYIFLIYDTGEFEKPEPGTITIITHDAIKANYLGVRDNEMLVKRMYEILSQGDRYDDPREATKLYDKIIARVESSVGSAKICIEDLCIDYIVIDEAHAFKKIFTSLKGEVQTDRSGNVIQREVTKGGETSKFAEREFNYYDLDYGEPSGMALSGYLLAQYIQMNNNGENTLLLTATPFENSPLEIYSMLSMSNHKVLNEYGFKGIKDFFDTFMKIEYDFKVKINGVERDTVLNGFVNLIQLRTIVRNIILHRTGEQIEGLIKPDKVVLPLYNSNIVEGITTIETRLVPTEEQRNLINKIEAYINGEISLNQIQYEETEKDLIEELIKEEEQLIEEQFSDEDGKVNIKQIKKDIVIDSKFQTESESEGTRIIQGINYIKQITCSPYLLKLKREAGIKMPSAKEFIETSPKLHYITECIKSVKKYHESKGTPVSGQIIYMTWGKMFFPLIKEYLTDTQFGIGFAKDEVEIISGEQSKNRKEELKKAFNENKIKVLIASKAIQVGADLQKHTSVLYHVFYDWNPTDNEQINGRMWRQGNKHLAVRIVYPIVENSVDPVIFQYLEEKTMRIKDVWDLSNVKSQLDLSEFDPKKLKIDAISDPDKKAKLAISIEEEKLKEEINYYKNILEPIRNVPYVINQFKNSYEKILSIHKEYFEARKAYNKNTLNKEKEDKIALLQTELNSIQEPISKLENEIKNIENQFDDKINILNNSLSELDVQLEKQLAEIKSKITDAVLSGQDDIVIQLKKQYNELPKIYKEDKKNEIQNKINSLTIEKQNATKKYYDEISELNNKIGEKIDKINIKINELNQKYDKKISESDEYYQDKINKTSDFALFENKQHYYTFLYSNCTEIIKFIDAKTDESEYYSSEFEHFKARSYDYRSECIMFKQYRDEYYRAIKMYLEPMNIKEEDAMQVVQVYQSKINELIEKLNNIENIYQDLYVKYDAEYKERLANAKTPLECAKDFAQLNVLLDHVRTEQLFEESISEEKLPNEQEIQIESPQAIEEEISDEIKKPSDETKQSEPDEKYISGKIKLFEKVLKYETDEKSIAFIKTKIKLFNRVLESIKTEIQVYEKGGIIESKSNIKKITSYVDLVEENLMTRKDFVQYMKINGENILPRSVYLQIKDCLNYDIMIDILKSNNLI